MSLTRLAAPIACGCALAGAALYVALADPATGSGFLPCPLYQTTGIYCPGCGLTRATRALLRGDVPAALGYNLLLPLVVAAVVVGWLSWVRVSVGRTPIRVLTTMPSWAAIALGVGVVAFGVLRNVPGFGALAP